MKSTYNPRHFVTVGSQEWVASEFRKWFTPQNRESLEHAGIEDLEAFACFLLGFLVHWGGDESTKGLKKFAAYLLDTSRPLIAAYYAASTGNLPENDSGRMGALPDGRVWPHVLPGDASQDLAMLYLFERTLNDMDACERVRERFRARRQLSPVEHLMFTSSYVEKLRRQCGCFAYRPCRVFWRALGLRSHNGVFPLGSAENHVERALAVAGVSARVREELRGALLESIDIWEEVEPAIEEAASYVYTGRYHLLPEQEERIATWLRMLNAIDRHVGVAAGRKADKLRKEMRAPSHGNNFYSLACHAMKVHRALPRHLRPGKARKSG
jgi:hypothetical protein